MYRLTHGFGLLALSVEDGELKLCTHFALGTAYQEQIEGQVVFTLLIQAFWIDPQTPGQEDNVNPLAP